MKKNLTIFFLLFAFLFLCGLTNEEAHTYGSNIIVCGKNEKVIKYWTLTARYYRERRHTENLVFDLMTKDTYKLAECRLYECSPDPSRMNGCKLPH